jgi:DNA-binding GntR family transcriptional regulator
VTKLFHKDRFRSLSDMVYESLRNLILTGEIEEGARINEVHVAEAMGVSKTPVREALRQLYSEGLVVISRHSGAVVRRITADDINHIYDIRISLEGLAVNLIVRNKVSRARLEKSLRPCLEKQILSVKQQKKLREIVLAGADFHKTIVALSDNPWLVKLLESLNNQLLRHIYLSHSIKGRSESVVKEHAHIAELIIMGDATNAEIALQNHLNGTRRELLAVLKNMEKGKEVEA